MTRINVGIRPSELPNKLLLAEHREITRIPNIISYGRAIVKNIPSEFRLGQGHVKFFYNKLGYLHKRYKLLYQECLNRGFKVTNKESSFDLYTKYPELFNDYEETIEDRQIIVERIQSKGFSLVD